MLSFEDRLKLAQEHSKLLKDIDYIKNIPGTYEYQRHLTDRVFDIEQKLKRLW